MCTFAGITTLAVPLLRSKRSETKKEENIGPISALCLFATTPTMDTEIGVTKFSRIVTKIAETTSILLK